MSIINVASLIERVTAGEAKAATELISAGESGVDISQALPALAAVLTAADERLVKEAIWAIYIIVWQGHALGDARPLLEQAATIKSLRGNAMIGLSLDDLSHGKVEETLAQMDDREDGDRQFGVAHALTDFVERTRDRALFERMIGKLPLGLIAPMLANGIASSILGQVARGAGSFAGQTLSDLFDSETDNVKSAILGGVLMRIQSRR